MEKVCVTGGAGFIGSNLVDRLIEKRFEVVIIDNLSTGKKENINKKAEFYKLDLRYDKEEIKKKLDGVKTIFHLAANPDVKSSSLNPKSQFDNNIVATYNILEIAKELGIKEFLFTSTSTVYGIARKIPTPEDYSPMLPISIYGASKLACEAMIIGYSYTYGIKSWIFRLANIIGRRATHGVLIDFIKKLRKNPNELEILGNGKQCKSYLYIEDCINAMLLAWKKANEQVNIFNIGNEDKIEVNEIAKIVCKELGLNPKFKYSSDEARGWVGDVPLMLLDITMIKKFGFKVRYNCKEAIKKAVIDCKN